MFPRDNDAVRLSLDTGHIIRAGATQFDAGEQLLDSRGQPAYLWCVTAPFIF